MKDGEKQLLQSDSSLTLNPSPMERDFKVLVLPSI